MRRFAAQHLLPAEGGDIDLVPRNAHGKGGAGGIGEGQSLAILGDPVAVRDADAGRRAVPGEENVMSPVDRPEVGQFPIIGSDQMTFDVELVGDVLDPFLPEAFPAHRGDGARAEHRPHRHLERAGIRAGDDSDPMAVGQFEHLAHQRDAVCQSRLVMRAAMRPAETVEVELVGAPAGRLGAGPG